MQPATRDHLIAQIADAEVRPFRRTTPQHLHDDLLQEAMIGAWLAIEKLDGSRSPREQQAYVGRAGRSKVISFLRYTQVRKREVPGGVMAARGGGWSDRSDHSQEIGREAGEVHGLSRVLTASGNGCRPDDEAAARDLARRIDQALKDTLASLSPDAQCMVLARLGEGEAPVLPRRRRDEYVRIAKERLAEFGHRAGLDLDLGAMIACQ